MLVSLPQDDGTTSELFDDLLSALLENCYPSPGKTPRYSHRSHRSTPRFRDANETNSRTDGYGEEEEENELSEEASSPRVALPASARKLAQALSSAGVPANEEQAAQIKMRQRTNSSDGFSSSQGDDDNLDGFASNDGDNEAYSQDTRLLEDQSHQHHHLHQRQQQQTISGASPGGASLNYLLQVTE